MRKDDETNKLLSVETSDVGASVEECIVTATKIFCQRTSSNFVSFLTDGYFTVSGTSKVDIVEGGTYLISGVVTEWNNRPQVKLKRIAQHSDSQSDKLLIASFLEDNITGVGKAIAQQLSDAFGDKVIDMIMNNPDECALCVKGLTKAKAILFSDAVTLKKDYFEKGIMLKLLGLSQAQIKECFALNMTDTNSIKQAPFELYRMNIASFEVCDKIASDMSKDRLDTVRIASAISSAVVRYHENTGSTYMTVEKCKKDSLVIANSVSADKITDSELNNVFQAACDVAVEDKKIILYKFINNKCVACKPEDDGCRISSNYYFKAESSIKKMLEGILSDISSVPDKAKSDVTMTRIGKGQGLIPDEDQLSALALCMYSPICIITGGPGTGKTTIMGILAEYYRQADVKCVFAAPTGRAAKRLSDSVGCEATTIHRLLGVRLVNGGDSERVEFVHNRDNPINAGVVVVDEMSMVDTVLFASLLEGLKPGTSLILVGDPDQLPSVGCGSVLWDLLSCKSIPSIKLTFRHRQGIDSAIAENAYRILQGEMPVGGSPDFDIISTTDDEEAFEVMKDLMSKTEGDVACLTPTKVENAKLGTVQLNKMMQDIKTGDVGKRIAKGKASHLALGDRVMQIKNDYDIEWLDPNTYETQQGVFNGEIGQVCDVNLIDGQISVEFDDGKVINYKKKLIEELELAYAITVHKAQGCEFDNCIISLGKMSALLYQRRLLYTAVTRGKKKVTIVDSGNCLKHFLKDGGRRDRDTSLQEFLAIIDAKRSLL